MAVVVVVVVALVLVLALVAEARFEDARCWLMRGKFK